MPTGQLRESTPVEPTQPGGYSLFFGIYKTSRIVGDSNRKGFIGNVGGVHQLFVTFNNFNNDSELRMPST